MAIASSARASWRAKTVTQSSVRHAGGAPVFRKDAAALLVIDPQVDFVPMVEGGAEAALAAMARLLEAVRAAGVPVVVTQEFHRPELVDFGRELDGDEPVHCIDGTAGAALLPGFEPRAGEFMIPKRRYSAFFATDLDLLLRGLGVRTVVVCGLLTDVCVHYTCADAHQLDYRVYVVPEACAGSTPAASEAAFAALERLQRGAVGGIEAACAALAAPNIARMSSLVVGSHT